MIGLLIIGLIIGVGAAILLAGCVVKANGDAKNTAREMISAGVITDITKADQTLSLLSAMGSSDMESADLWKRLNDLRQSYTAKSI